MLKNRITRQLQQCVVFLMASCGFWLGAARPSNAQQEIQLAIEVLEQVTLAPRQDGFIVDFDALVGRRLEKGQMVVQLDKRTNQLDLRRAVAEAKSLSLLANDQSGLQIAKSQLRTASENYSRLSKASNSGRTRIPELELIRAGASQMQAQAEVDKAKVEAQRAGSDLVAKQAEVELLKLESDFLSLRAPFTGNVAEVFRYPGDFVSKGNPIATIYRLDKLAAVALIEQTVVPIQNAVGRKVRVNLAGQPQVLEILRVSPRVDEVDSYRAFFEIDNRRDPATGRWQLFPGIALAGEFVN